MSTWTVEAGQEGRVDVFLTGVMGISRGEAQRLLDSGCATVNGQVAKSNRKLKAGEVVTAERQEPVPSTVTPEDIPLEIVFEDEDVLVINKPRGMVVHPAPGNEGGTLVNAVLAHAEDLSGIGGELRPGIVHRLDKDTSGLLVVAKNDAAHQSLQSQIQAKTAERIYQAVLWGVPRFGKALVDAPIGRHPSDRKKMAVITDEKHTSRSAVTELNVLEALSVFSYVQAQLQTGRTHQIRVHCTYIGHPVVGDALYGGLRKVPSSSITTLQRNKVEHVIDALGGQALHAAILRFDHPRTGERLSFQTPLPNVMQNLLDTLREVYGR